MKNPCKNCLVRSMCFAIPCGGLSTYMNFLIKENKLDKKFIPNWITHYEVRPKVIDHAKELGIINGDFNDKFSSDENR